jgi:CRISPR-associated protein Csm3
MDYEFLGVLDIRSTIHVLTGLHIGGPDIGKEIGGIDAKIVRTSHPRHGANSPYIPGSSIRGKMRSLLEWAHSRVDGRPHNCADSACKVCRVFGTSDRDWQGGPTRLLVHDAYPTDGTWEEWERSGAYGAELKSENYINRITSEANPRTFERVPPGSEFELEMAFLMFNLENEESLEDVRYLPLVVEGLDLVEASHLGRAGSRGYGRVRFRDRKAVVRSKADIRAGEEGVEVPFREMAEGVLNHLRAEG